ncbi:MAG TPA: hypothetical protein VFZ73_15795, partial [Gemmatimonadaceae bacterium]
QQSGKERKMRFDGTAPVTIADGGSANGADWTIRDEIVSGATLNFRGLARVSAAGGVMAEFTHPDTTKNERQHNWPIALPDGKHVVFAIWYGNLEATQLALASIDDGQVTELGIKGIRPLAVLDDRIVYIQADGTIMAVRVNAKGRAVVGNAIPVHDPVPVLATNNGNSGAYLSRGGALVTSRGQLQTQLTWLARDGMSRRPILADLRTFSQPVLSPDERRLLVLAADNQRTDAWIYDFTTGTFSRLTTSGTVTSASWSSDGSHVYFTGRGERERTAFWRQPASGGSAPEKLMEVGELAPSIQLTPEGRWLLYQAYYNNTWDFFQARLDSAPVASRPYVASSANEMNPRFSPDGRWVAFLSDESGRAEVVVRSFPDPQSRVQVSSEGAGEIVWADDGKRIYYRSGAALLTATVELSPVFRVLRRDTLIRQMPNPTTFGTSYDVARDGRIVALYSNRDNFELVVSPNWITEFRQRIAASERTTRR